MARQIPRTLFWTLDPEGSGHTHGNLYMGDASDGDFLAAADAGSADLVARIPAGDPQEFDITALDVEPGNYQFAVVAEASDLGKFSDPAQHEDWVSVPLDNTPLPPAVPGGIRSGG